MDILQVFDMLSRFWDDYSNQRWSEAYPHVSSQSSTGALAALGASRSQWAAWAGFSYGWCDVFGWFWKNDHNFLGISSSHSWTLKNWIPEGFEGRHVARFEEQNYQNCIRIGVSAIGHTQESPKETVRGGKPWIDWVSKEACQRKPLKVIKENWA